MKKPASLGNGQRIIQLSPRLRNGRLLSIKGFPSFIAHDSQFGSWKAIMKI
ncbi:hypothetical protein [Pradoshia sp. D12]|uniref:hypothetical protein n=1 Tax=Pradoshia sp. D12 TaxID=2651284 RepID=UPI00178C73BB|nr:hypothetical protein [Pradoshia sp. D12]